MPRTLAPTSAEIAAMAKEQKEWDKKAKEAAEKRDSIKPKLVAAMRSFGSRVMEAGGVRVVLTEGTQTEYDEDGILSALTSRQRKLAFDEVVNISLLPIAERREIEEKMREILTTSQRKRATELRFNLDRMSQAVQAGTIPVEVLDQHTEIVPRTPYTTVTFK